MQIVAAMGSHIAQVDGSAVAACLKRLGGDAVTTGFTHDSCRKEILEETNFDPTCKISKQSEKHKHGTPNPGPASIKKH